MKHSLDTSLFSLFTHLPSNPAAGSSASFTISDTRRSLITTVTLTLTTDANAGNRLVTVDGDSAIGLNESASPVVQAASETYIYHFVTGITPLDHASGHNLIYAPLASNMFTDPTNAFTITVNNIKATDQISTIILTGKQWISI